MSTTSSTAEEIGKTAREAIDRVVASRPKDASWKLLHHQVGSSVTLHERRGVYLLQEHTLDHGVDHGPGDHAGCGVVVLSRGELRELCEAGLTTLGVTR